MVAKDENGNNAKVPGLIVDDEDGIRRFVRSISRYDEAKKRRARFSEEEFKAHNYIDLLKTQNVKINI